MRLVWLVCLTAIPALGQAPQIASGGIVNAASFDSPVAPGAIVLIFGSNLASSPESATPPFPLKLGGTSVTMSGLPAPDSLRLAGPDQCAGTGRAGREFRYANASVVFVTTVVVTAGASASGTIGLVTGFPGFFTADGSGCGQAAALNITPAGVVSVNSPSNGAAPGDYVTLFGTGLGLAAAQPPDGAAAATATSLLDQPGVVLNMGTSPTTPSYAGLAPALPGVDQVNFQIPAGTRNGCAVPVSVYQTFGGQTVTISVQNGRGQCSDPPIQSYGSISLSSSVLSAPGVVSPSPGEFFSAVFPAGPGLVPPPPSTLTVVNGAIFLANPLEIRSCPVPGYSDLSVGAITIQGPSGAAMTAQPVPVASGGVSYSLSLPSGFMGQGTYTITGGQGSAIALNTRIPVGSPIAVVAPQTAISSSQPLTVTWTGGDSSSVVTVTLNTSQESYSSTTTATAGTLTIQPPCNFVSGGCSFGPAASDVQISVEVLLRQLSLKSLCLV